MRKRQGFALLWAVSAVSIVFLLGGTAFFMLRAALRSEQAMEIEADEAFLVQEVMETIKYNSRLQGALPVPSGDLERNGRRYHILIEENHRTIEGVEMREVSCTVTDKTGTSFSAVLLLERHEAEGVHSYGSPAGASAPVSAGGGCFSDSRADGGSHGIYGPAEAGSERSRFCYRFHDREDTE